MDWLNQIAQWLAAIAGRARGAKGYELPLRDGRTIHLEQLFQYRTYRGLLEGLPNAVRNQELVLSASRDAEEKLWGDGRPYLLRPAERYVAVPDEVRQRYRCPLRELPRVLCLAVFESFRPARDDSEIYSYLKVVWFQDEFALPVAWHIELPAGGGPGLRR